MSVGVIDYGAGNLKSVETVLRHLGADFFISQEPEEIVRAERLVFPGVGEARAAMEVLKKTGLDQAVIDFFASGKPLLGICIGCQIALERSEERNTPCLSLIEGKTRRFPADLGLKVPHMGWNQVIPKSRKGFWDGIPSGSSFYFVHSYFPEPRREEQVLATTEYGLTFASAIGKENLVAVQFHPEKSGEVGLRLISNFLKWNP
jgi:glutamine amidotransferase